MAKGGLEPNLLIRLPAANVLYWVGVVPATQNSFRLDLTRSAKKSTNNLTRAVFFKSRCNNSQMLL